jgi:dihydrofolate reductase
MDKKLSDLLDYCRSNNRVCPKNIYWNAFYSLLPDKENKRSPAPLFVPESGMIYDSLRQLRLAEQIYWAYANDAIEECDHFLKSLSEDQWHHTDESGPTNDLGT